MSHLPPKMNEDPRWRHMEDGTPAGSYNSATAEYNIDDPKFCTPMSVLSGLVSGFCERQAVVMTGNTIGGSAWQTAKTAAADAANGNTVESMTALIALGKDVGSTVAELANVVPSTDANFMMISAGTAGTYMQVFDGLLNLTITSGGYVDVTGATAYDTFAKVATVAVQAAQAAGKPIGTPVSGGLAYSGTMKPTLPTEWALERKWMMEVLRRTPGGAVNGPVQSGNGLGGSKLAMTHMYIENTSAVADTQAAQNNNMEELYDSIFEEPLTSYYTSVHSDGDLARVELVPRLYQATVHETSVEVSDHESATYYYWDVVRNQWVTNGGRTYYVYKEAYKRSDQTFEQTETIPMYIAAATAQVSVVDYSSKTPVGSDVVMGATAGGNYYVVDGGTLSIPWNVSASTVYIEPGGLVVMTSSAYTPPPPEEDPYEDDEEYEEEDPYGDEEEQEEEEPVVIHSESQIGYLNIMDGGMYKPYIETEELAGGVMVQWAHLGVTAPRYSYDPIPLSYDYVPTLLQYPTNSKYRYIEGDFNGVYPRKTTWKYEDYRYLLVQKTSDGAPVVSIMAPFDPNDPQESPSPDGVEDLYLIINGGTVNVTGHCRVWAELRSQGTLTTGSETLLYAVTVYSGAYLELRGGTHMQLGQPIMIKSGGTLNITGPLYGYWQLSCEEGATVNIAQAAGMGVGYGQYTDHKALGVGFASPSYDPDSGYIPLVGCTAGTQVTDLKDYQETLYYGMNVDVVSLNTLGTVISGGLQIVPGWNSVVATMLPQNPETPNTASYSVLGEDDEVIGETIMQGATVSLPIPVLGGTVYYRRHDRRIHYSSGGDSYVDFFVDELTTTDYQSGAPFDVFYANCEYTNVYQMARIMAINSTGPGTTDHYQDFNLRQSRTASEIPTVTPVEDEEEEEEEEDD